jgi:dTDP-4-amino-4,6-dideoxygalactose transaminase
LIEHLKRQSILAVFHYVPLHTSPMGLRMGGHPGGCPVAEDISARLLRLPFFTDLSIDDQGIVLDAVCQFTV